MMKFRVAILRDATTLHEVEAAPAVFNFDQPGI